MNKMDEQKAKAEKEANSKDIASPAKETAPNDKIAEKAPKKESGNIVRWFLGIRQKVVEPVNVEMQDMAAAQNRKRSSSLG